MPSTTATLPALAVLLASGTAPAWADIVPSDVWAAWQGPSGPPGTSVTAVSEGTAPDGTLTLEGVRVTADSGAGAEVSYDIDAIVLRPRPGGGVAVELPDALTSAIRVMRAEGGVVELALDYGLDAVTATATGDPGAIAYDVAADAVSADVRDATEDGVAMGLAARIAATSVVGAWAPGDGGPEGETEQSFAAGEVTVSFDRDTPADPAADTAAGRLSVKGAWRGIESATRGTPNLATVTAPETLPGDAGLTSRTTHGGGGLALAFRDESDLFEMTTGSGGGEVNVSLSGGILDYGIRGDDLSLTMGGTRIPEPGVEATLDTAQLTASAGVAPTDTAVPASVRIVLDGLMPGDAIWTAMDPQGVLPRDPARFVLDIGGMARPSGEAGALAFDTVELRALELGAAGARLSGSGAIAFPEGTELTPGGLQSGTGEIDLRLEGATALIDALVRLGVVGADQAAGARMMLGFFAAPVPGEDAVTSRVEFSSGGGISVNGQRIR